MPKYKSEIDSVLKHLNLTSVITRRNFQVGKSMTWKASENRTFYLYLALPLLANYLPKDYIIHLYCFVYGNLIRKFCKFISKAKICI